MTIRARRSRRVIPSIFVAVVISASWLSGCSGLQRILDFEEQEMRSRAMSRIEGRVETEGPHEGILVVILGRVIDGEEGVVGVDSYVRLKSGSYVFGVSPGRFQVGAYEDRNRNGMLDPGERAVRVRDGRILEVGPGERARFDIRLAIGASLDELTEPIDVLAIVERTPEEQREFSLWAFSAQGRICEDLDDPRFGLEAGPHGLWEPMDFLNDELAGIYFLEPYDPNRIPVLFVHGISGYPQEFEALIKGLDRERFQPWFYFYPSGFGLEGISRHLQGLLERIQSTARFDRLGIVAHSMGGLVSRGAILRYSENTGRDDVGILITLATPWGGDVSAAGTADAPIMLPDSFSDMGPSSEYLGWLFYHDQARESVKTLPKGVDYHMIVGFHMNRSRDVADDGRVTMASQTRMEAQEEALSVRAWDYSHADILRSPEAVARMNLLLHERFD